MPCGNNYRKAYFLWAKNDKCIKTKLIYFRDKDKFDIKGGLLVFMKSKYFKTKIGEGEFSEEIYFAVDSDNVELSDGNTLTNKIKDIDTAIVNNGNTINTLDSAVASMSTRIETQENQISTLTTTTSNLNNSVNTMANNVAIAQTDIETLKQNDTTINSKVQSNTNNITNIKNDITNIKSNITNINDTLTTTCRLESTSLTCTLPDNL